MLVMITGDLPGAFDPTPGSARVEALAGRGSAQATHEPAANANRITNMASNVVESSHEDHKQWRALATRYD